MDEAAAFEVKVDKYLEDLIPDYLRNRQKEAQELGAACASGDFKRVGEIAHRMIGVGTPYGFVHVTDLARRLRAAALAGDQPGVEAMVGEYRDYVAKVRVVFE